MPPLSTEMLSLAEVCALFGVCRRTIEHWRQRRNFPKPMRVERKLRWPRESIQEYLKAYKLLHPARFGPQNAPPPSIPRCARLYPNPRRPLPLPGRQECSGRGCSSRCAAFMKSAPPLNPPFAAGPRGEAGQSR